MAEIVELSRLFSFEASHELKWYQGKCNRLHGHSYKLQVTISGKLNENGILMDFHEIKSIVNSVIIDILDHSYLNDIIENPTAENTIIWIWNKLNDKLPLKELILWETYNSFVKYSGNQE